MFIKSDFALGCHLGKWNLNLAIKPNIKNKLLNKYLNLLLISLRVSVAPISFYGFLKVNGNTALICP